MGLGVSRNYLPCVNDDIRLDMVHSDVFNLLFYFQFEDFFDSPVKSSILTSSSGYSRRARLVRGRTE